MQVRSRKGLYLWGGVDKTGDPILTTEVFHAVHITLSLSWGIMRASLSSSMVVFCRGPCSLFYLRSWYRFQSVHPWVQFLPTAESSPGLPGASWQLLAGQQRPSTQLRGTQYLFCIFYLISLNIISVIKKTFYI